MSSISHSNKKIVGNQYMSQQQNIFIDTLAIGGRYDNHVAQFQPVEIPMAVGVRIFCNKLVQKVLAYEVW